MLPLVATPAWAYDLDNGNAAFEIVIQSVAPEVPGNVSASGGDATLVLRLTTMITNAWFDAVAPYHPTAVGVYSRFERQPAPDSNEEMNVALLYASYQVLNSLLPQRAAVWEGMLIAAGLAPDNPDMDDLSTPAGIGTAAGLGVVNGRSHDGMNQLGDLVDRGYNRVPYADYTGYQPVNTAYELRDPARWQPDIQRQLLGLFKVQQFVTPQYALVEPYSYADPEDFAVPPPQASMFPNSAAYQQQADAVLSASANLDDMQKLKAELFDDKIRGLGFSAVHAALSQGLNLYQFVALDFLTNMAAFDAGIFVWNEKREYDAVRPFSAIQYLYGEQPVAAWGGPGQGTVYDLPASEWKSYLEEADHPEYPSASTCFCAAHAQAARLYLPGGDALNWTLDYPAGASRVEPGLTPAVDTQVHFATWSEFAADCGVSRVWAGVHFPAAVEASAAVCGSFGDLAYDYFVELEQGTAAERGPSVGRQWDAGPGKGKGRGKGRGNSPW